jgi:hypothetical protein
MHVALTSEGIKHSFLAVPAKQPRDSGTTGHREAAVAVVAVRAKQARDSGTTGHREAV